MPQQWIDRDDRVAGDCEAGPVNDDEPVARLLDNQSWKDGAIADAIFQSRYLMPRKEPIVNTVGARSGESLIRCVGMSDEELLARSTAQLAESSQGTAVALVADIRQITSHDDQSVRLFRIYEDPTPEVPQHAVIRFDPAYKAQWPLARSRLIKAFRKI